MEMSDRNDSSRGTGTLSSSEGSLPGSTNERVYDAQEVEMLELDTRATSILPGHGRRLAGRLSVSAGTALAKGRPIAHRAWYVQ